jgi:hypothetical protein
MRAAAEREPNCRSIVFPILAPYGPRRCCGARERAARRGGRILESENAKQIDTAYVLTWTDVEFDMCKRDSRGAR